MKCRNPFFCCDFDLWEQKSQGAKVPWNEMTGERKGQGTKSQGANWPGSELARVLLADLLQGVNWPGSERAWYQEIHSNC